MGYASTNPRFSVFRIIAEILSDGDFFPGVLKAVAKTPKSEDLNFLCCPKKTNCMRKILIALAGVLFLANCGQQNADSKPTATEGNKSFYGEIFEPTNVLSEPEMVKSMEGGDSSEVVFESKVIETCAHEGCWMTVQSTSGYPMYVYMKDHAFAVPLSGAGDLRCVVKGIAYRDTLSVKQLQHFAEDAGKAQAEIDAINAPLAVIAVDATGVMIEGYKPTENGGEHNDHEGHDHEGHDHGH
jgi:hypothetical protein